MRLKKYTILCTLLVVLFASCGRDAVIVPSLYAPVTAQADSALVTRGVVKSLEVLPGITRRMTDAVRLESGYGRIGAIYAWPGDSVVAGQAVARLDTAHLETTIENFEESISRSNTLHHLRMREMALEIEIAELSLLDAPEDMGLLNRIDWLRLDRNHLQRRHELSMTEMEATLTGLLGRLDNAEIRAPFDGEIVALAYLFDGMAMHTLAVGTWVNTHDHIMYITRPGGVFVEYTGTEIDAAQLRTAVRVQGVINRVAYDLEPTPLTAYELLHYNQRRIDPPLRFEIINGPDDMPPGQPVFIHPYTAFADNTLRIPGNALFFDGQNEPLVYRIEEGRQVRVDVAVGTITDVYIEILAGLDEGDEVFVRP